MATKVVLTIAAALMIAMWMTAVVRRLALARGVLDIPNERSSHKVPTPRGGGIAIVAATVAGWATLVILQVMSFESFAALAGGGTAVALVGYFDDRRRVAVGTRLVVHFAAAAWALAWLGGLPPIHAGGQLVSLGAAGYLLGIAGIVWVLNLFNFMDGIDGIAASEAVFVACAGAVLGGMGAVLHGTSATALVFAAACAGFLWWNWPPARIFMGDVGSGFAGYAIAVLALSAARESPTALVSWLLLGGVFFVDASVTLAYRLLRGERVHEAHRFHAYQHLARRMGHRPVTVGVIAIDVLWLFPWALAATRFPAYSLWILGLGLTPLVFVALFCGAGRRESIR